MVYIHGGGWFSGSAHPIIVGPEYIMDTQEVILVTFAYRLGALGFLSTGDNTISGNFGLKDQVLALKWVQKNIGAFGGNPRQVTIFGQSVGGVAAHMHMLSKQSAGLFSGVIAMSGTANVPFAIAENPLEQAIKTAEFCNITDAGKLSKAKLLRALRNVSAVDLVNAGDGLKYWDVDHITDYRPVVEHHSVKDAFFTKHPNEILAKADYKPVPLLLGSVPNEGAVRVVAILENEKLRKSFNENFMTLLETFLQFPSHFSSNRLKHNMELILDHYFNGTRELGPATSQGFLDVSFRNQIISCH